MIFSLLQVQNISKQYRLGVIGTGTLYQDLYRSWAKFRGKEDPYSIIGEDDLITTKTDDTNVWALRNISFEINRGEVLGVIGKNGAGKSTLLKVISRVTSPTSGKIILEGRIATLLEVGTGFHPELTGRENIFLNGAILGMSKNEIVQKEKKIIEFSGVGKYIDTPVKRYSSGMYVRLAFSVAAHIEPDILIVDEVLAVGDSSFQTKCIEKMKDIANSGTAVLFVSHNLGIVKSICNRSLLLDGGKMEFIGETDQVISKYLNVDDISLSRDLANAARVQSNGKLSFKKCSIGSVNGKAKRQFNIGEDIQLDFSIISKFEGKVGFWIIFRDQTSNPIICSHQKDQIELSIKKGNYLLSFKTSQFSLLPGQYIISAGVMDYEYTTFFEWIENCQSFEILPAFNSGVRYDNRLGYVVHNGNWDLKNKL